MLGAGALPGNPYGSHGLAKRIDQVAILTEVDGLLERNHFAGCDGGATNVIFFSAGHNMRLLVHWMRLLVLMFLAKILRGVGNHPDHQAPAITA